MAYNFFPVWFHFCVDSYEMWSSTLIYCTPRHLDLYFLSFRFEETIPRTVLKKINTRIIKDSYDQKQQRTAA